MGRGGYQAGCFGCLSVFPKPPAAAARAVRAGAGEKREARAANTNAKANANTGGVSESSRYECESCGYFFCIDCDVFAHEVVHNCPGCLSREGELARRNMVGGRGVG